MRRDCRVHVTVQFPVSSEREFRSVEGLPSAALLDRSQGPRRSPSLSRMHPSLRRSGLTYA